MKSDLYFDILLLMTNQSPVLMLVGVWNAWRKIGKKNTVIYLMKMVIPLKEDYANTKCMYSKCEIGFILLMHLIIFITEPVNRVNVIIIQNWSESTESYINFLNINYPLTHIAWFYMLFYMFRHFEDKYSQWNLAYSPWCTIWNKTYNLVSFPFIFLPSFTWALKWLLHKNMFLLMI